MANNQPNVKITLPINLSNATSFVSNVNNISNTYSTNIANTLNNLSNVMLPAVQLPGSTGSFSAAGLGINDVLQINNTIICENYRAEIAAPTTIINNTDIYLGCITSLNGNITGPSDLTNYVGNINLASINGIKFNLFATTTYVDNKIDILKKHVDDQFNLLATTTHVDNELAVLRQKIDALYQFFFHETIMVPPDLVNGGEGSTGATGSAGATGATGF